MAFQGYLSSSKNKRFSFLFSHTFGQGGNASHGASKSHRQLGSTGSAQDPGHVIRGKKMPGRSQFCSSFLSFFVFSFLKLIFLLRLGNKFRTTQNLRVFRVVPELNMLAVIGHVPGAENGIVEVKYSSSCFFPLCFERLSRFGTRTSLGRSRCPRRPSLATFAKKQVCCSVLSLSIFVFHQSFLLPDVIKPYSEFKDGTPFVDLKGPMPMPWRLQVAAQAGWHIPR